MRRRSAFTLIELLVVVAIIGILAAIAVPNFLNARMKAKIGQTYGRLKSMQTAINLYILDQGRRFDGVGADNPYGFINKNNIDPELFAIGRRYASCACSCFRYYRLTTPVSYLTSLETRVDPLDRHELLLQIPAPDKQFCFSYLEINTRTSLLYFQSASRTKIDVDHNNTYVLLSAGPSGNGPKGMNRSNHLYEWEHNEFFPYAASNGLTSMGALAATDRVVFP